MQLGSNPARTEVLVSVPAMAAFLGETRTVVDTPTTQWCKQKVGNGQNTKGEYRQKGHMLLDAGTDRQSFKALREPFSLSLKTQLLKVLANISTRRLTSAPGAAFSPPPTAAFLPRLHPL